MHLSMHALEQQLDSIFSSGPALPLVGMTKVLWNIELQMFQQRVKVFEFCLLFTLHHSF